MPLDALPPLRGAASPAPPAARTSRAVFEDWFHTYTGCESIQSFLALQKEGAKLSAALREGSGLPVAAVQPRVQPQLQEWYEAIKAKQQQRPRSKWTGLAAPTAVAAAAVPPWSTQITADGAVAKESATPDNGEEEDAADLASHLLPPLEELPAIVRCDPGAVVAVRRKVEFYYTRLFELIELATAFASRWGRLTTQERSWLKEAMQAEKRARVGEDALFETLEELTFTNEGLERLLPTDMALCNRVRVLRCSNNLGLMELDALPRLCHTVVACACSLQSITAISPAISVMGLSFNNLTKLSFLSHFPSLRVLDVSANHLASIEDAIAAVNAHRELSELSLAGNPIALLDHCRSRIAVACPRIAKLDGRLILAEERRLEGVAGSAVLSVPVATRSASRSGRRQRSFAAGSHPSCGGTRGANAAAQAAAAAAAAVEAEAEADRRVALTVRATAELLAVKGLSALTHTPVLVNLTEDVRPKAVFLQKAAGVDCGKEGSNAHEIVPRHATVPPLDLSGAGVGGDKGTTGSFRRSAKQQPKSASRKGRVDSAGSTSNSAGTEHATHAKARPGSRGGAAPPKDTSPLLYEYGSTLVIRGVWGAGEEEEGAEETEAIHIATVAIPLCCSAGFCMPGTAFPPASAGIAGRGAAPPAAMAAGRPSVSLHRGVSLGQQQKDSDSASAVVDGVYRPSPADREHWLFTASSDSGGLAVTPDLALRLRRPFHLHVEVRDAMRFPDQATVLALVEGGGAANGVATTATTTPRRPATAVRHGNGSAHKRLSTALASAQQWEQQCERTEELVYHLGTILVDPAELVLEPPSAVPPHALLALAEQAEARATANASPASAAKPAALTVDPAQCYQRELRLQGCALERGAADRRAARLRLEEVRKALRCAMAEYDNARADALEEARKHEELVPSSVALPSPHAGLSPGKVPSSSSSVGHGCSHSSSSLRRRSSVRPPASAAAVQQNQAEVSARHAAVVALAVKAAVLERRLEELWGKEGNDTRAATDAPKTMGVSVDLRLAIGRGPMTPAAAAIAQREMPPAPTTTTRTRKAPPVAGSTVTR